MFVEGHAEASEALTERPEKWGDSVSLSRSAHSLHVTANRACWQRWAADYAAAGERAWAAAEPTWGIWGLPESQARMFPASLRGLDTVELGCGTGYVSAWIARRGGRPIGIDNSWAQLETARRLQRQHGLVFPLVHADAERTPLGDRCADLVISEYGACLWCDPHRWIPEAARLLRPGGELRFLTNAYLLSLVLPPEVERASERLARPQFGDPQMRAPDGSVEFHVPHGTMIRWLRANGFEVLDLVELETPADATTRCDWVTAEWASRWPSEEVWRAVKKGG